MNEETKGPTVEDFVVERTSADKLTDAEMAQCVAIVREGKAIRRGFETQGLKETAVLAVVRQSGEIVGVGAIKKPRDYTATVAGYAGYDFPVHTPELGYIAVSKAGNDLSPRIVATLLDGHQGAVFATTSHPKIKTVLTAAGFEARGREWKGNSGSLLSLWIKG